MHVIHDRANPYMTAFQINQLILISICILHQPAQCPPITQYPTLIPTHSRVYPPLLSICPPAILPSIFVSHVIQNNCNCLAEDLLEQTLQCILEI